MSGAYGVNLSESMIATLDEVPDQLLTLSYGAGKKFKAILLYLILPVAFATIIILGAEQFAEQLPTNVFKGLMATAGLGFLFLLIGVFKANKKFSPQYIFTSAGMTVNSKMMDWSTVSHVEVLATARSGDKASIIIYLEDEQTLGLKIQKHELRMKVSEVLRCNVSNIAFKD
ncbi:hypothetical protein MNBD_GAMMA12-1588 [hydrothermal vent metagenome]|uniref:Uncharacterized protein n=1 Tax=hydrothermal vent metagenome TaxID=652676 RepID=A0A3B0Y817_9ZZZZ